MENIRKILFKILIAVLLCTLVGMLVYVSMSSNTTVLAQQQPNINNTEQTIDDVKIDATNFPDAVFRSWLTNANNLDGYGADGILTAQELQQITEILILPSDGLLTDLTGIEHFYNLQKLMISNHKLTKLDLTANTNLTYVNCSYNRLRELYVSGLSKMTSFICEFNYLQQLDLSGLVSLLSIYCRHNLLTSIDFSDCTELVFIETFDNQLTSVDVSMLSKLEFLHIDHNKLTFLDMSHNLNLKNSGFVVRNNDCRELRLPKIDNFEIDFEDIREQNPIDGYERHQWYFDKEYTQPVTGNFIAQGQILYGKRIPNDYTINFYGSGASNMPTLVNAQYDTQATLPDNIPTRNGYIFVGWGTDLYNATTVYQAGESVLNLAGKRYNGGKVTLYAQWQPITYTIVFDKNATDATGTMESMTVSYGATQTLNTVSFVREKYDFVGWAKTSSGKAIYTDQYAIYNLTYIDKAVVTLYAVWELNAEETARPYLQEVQQIYDKHLSYEYAQEDFDGIANKFFATKQQIADANKNTTAMRKAVNSFNEYVQTVPLLSERVDQVYDSWITLYYQSLYSVFNPPVTKGSGEMLTNLAKEALQSSIVENLANFSTLTQHDSKMMVAIKANQRLQQYIDKLQTFLPVGEWLISAEKICDTNTQQVLSTHWGEYNSILQVFDNLTTIEQSYVDGQIVSALQLRRDLSATKQYALDTLQRNFDMYNQQDYNQQQWQQLLTIFQQAITNIESASNQTAVNDEVINAVVAFGKVPTKDEIVEPTPDPEPEPEEPEQPGTETPDQQPPEAPDNTALIVTVSVISGTVLLGGLGVVVGVLSKKYKK